MDVLVDYEFIKRMLVPTPYLNTGSLVINVPVTPEFQQILSPDALAFVTEPHRRFDERRRELLRRLKPNSYRY